MMQLKCGCRWTCVSRGVGRRNDASSLLVMVLDAVAARTLRPT
jgi:hypothetical protein